MAGNATTFNGDPKILRKHPSDSVRVEFEFATYRLITGQGLSGSPTVSATPTGLTIGSPTISGTEVHATVSGGTAGVMYAITCECPATTPTETLTISGGISVNNPP